MYFSKEHISKLERIKRINLINSITGIKPVLLIGTKSNDNISNLAIFSSIVHISSNPSLFGFFIRTNSKIRRDTYENIIENNVYTFNHIHSLEIRKSHFTSIKFQKNISEFDRCKFTEQYFITRLSSGKDIEFGSDPNTNNGGMNIYGDPFTDTILKLSTDHISCMLGKHLLPTYSYVRFYQRGDELNVHTDRPECEYSVSLTPLGFDK